MASVTFDSVTRRYPGAERPALDALDLSVDDGEFMVLVGPSGCGKTTTLRMLAGLEPVDAGRIYIGSDDVTETDPGHRDIAMVFQNYALYPHMTVAQNLGFALKVAKTPKADIRTRVVQAARLLGLEAHLDRKPKDLSGGERQRVAMGRAIVRRPQVFLMDEPLSNLDAMLRVQTRNQVAELQRRLEITTVYVTHDQVEAMTMGDRVAVLCDGVLQQCATPRELYRRPANVFVAGFIGSPAMNLFTLPVVDGAVSLGGHALALPREIASSRDELAMGVRPEHLVLDDDGFAFDVDFVEELGADTYLYGGITESEGGARRPVTARVAGDNSVRRGDQVRLRPDPEHVHFFGADGVRLG
ncbi:ABC transporter ATP-binding protein [[Mycobacterium] crassicus]|uniref:Sn-glycerol-3-phosphate ABC transporter ATP-binding protein UgpC n=1 Tax=[Mycobacterium] crassicus TaxID=2872309 RepID=A0ABU5XI49_9MYCO|nr:sn-glycerol-3-phosphate ABC transporter ATP-binding protein UgpC [Mycolicibacter sp. MYC098]MEB3021955.1 sn-glycerol-3-phosphate ABC transporter ATP-binding protein UgpC [Mycolicibacter sp. MYC098]